MAALLLAACGSGGGRSHGPSAICSPPVQEQLDPRSTQHLLPGTAEPIYLSDPPTSGPHRLGNHPTGVLAKPIDRPRQVAMLEGGAVLVQYRDLERADQLQLEELAGDGATIAPAPGLPAAVVATAWRFKQKCRGVDLVALRAFVHAHAGKAGAEGP